MSTARMPSGALPAANDPASQNAPPTFWKMSSPPLVATTRSTSVWGTSGSSSYGFQLSGPEAIRRGAGTPGLDNETYCIVNGGPNQIGRASCRERGDDAGDERRDRVKENVESLSD